MISNSIELLNFTPLGFETVKIRNFGKFGASLNFTPLGFETIFFFDRRISKDLC